jgi:Mycoplasma protein of unknown function, DUF285
MRRTFCFARNFTGSGMGSWDTSRVTQMSQMFDYATSFNNGNIWQWNTGQVYDMVGIVE